MCPGFDIQCFSKNQEDLKLNDKRKSVDENMEMEKFRII